MTLGPVASALGSAKSIKAAIVSYNARVDTAEGAVLTALGEYEKSKEPAALQAAIENSKNVLGALEVAVSHQSAGTNRVKRAKARIVKGLQALVVGYGELSVAYGEKAASTEAAVAEATKALAAVKVGRKELLEGVKLLG
jgi:hypothetical protein